MLLKFNPQNDDQEKRNQYKIWKEFIEANQALQLQEILQCSYINRFTLLLQRTIHKTKSDRITQHKQKITQNKEKVRTISQNNLISFPFKQNRSRCPSRKSGNSRQSGLLKISNRHLEQRFSKLSRISRKGSQKMTQAYYFNNDQAQNSQAKNLYFQGQFQLALIQYFNQQNQLKSKVKEGILQQKSSQFLKQHQRIMMGIGNCFYRQKDYDKAIKYYKIQFQGEDSKSRGQRLNNLGSCYAFKKQNQLSLKSYNEALKIYAEHPQVDCSNLLNNIGIIYLKNNMNTSAQKFFEQSIIERKAKSPDNQEALLFSYFKLGLCQRNIGKYQQATNNLLFSLNIAEKGYSLADQILKHIAETYQLQQKYSQSLVYYEKLSDFYQMEEHSQGEVYQSVAKIHQKLGNFLQHDKFMKLALIQYKKINNERKLSELNGQMLLKKAQ